MSSAPSNQVSSHWKGRSATRQSPNLFSKIFFKKSTWRKDGFAMWPLKPHLTIFSMVGSLFLIINDHPPIENHALEWWGWAKIASTTSPQIPHSSFHSMYTWIYHISSTPHRCLSSFLSSIRNKFTWMETIYFLFFFKSRQSTLIFQASTATFWP